MYINNLVEMHSHIIPGIDDGSQHIETSLKMIAKLQEQGAEKIVLTPHYYSDDISFDDFLRRRYNAFNALLKALPPGSPALIPAAEVYISKYLFNNDNLKELCIGSSNYALIEHPFSASFDENDYNRLMNLYYDYGIRPVLAHIERYRPLIEDTYLLEEFIEMGALIQVNVNSFVDAHRSIRKKLFKLLDTGHIHIIGSDCHNLDTRPPEYEKGIKAIIKKSGMEAVETLMYNANQLVK